MNQNTKTALNIVVWTALVVYLILAAGYCSRQRADRVCTGLNIVVKDSLKIGLITRESVRSILVGERMRLTGARLDSINLLAVEKALTSQSYIRSAKVYGSLDGKLNIEVEQRLPVARIQTENGYRFFLSEDGYVMPLRSSSFIDVPIVTGTPELPFTPRFEGQIQFLENTEKKSAENYLFLQNLINFVEFLRRDSFWGTQVVQINVIPGNEVELVPRIGRGVILLGNLEQYQEKLDKLYTFYRRGLAYEGWNKYARINIKYDGQIVCSE